MKKLILFLLSVLLFSSLVSAQDSTGITVVELAKSRKSWDGTPLPDYPEKSPEITILRISIPPGASLPQHYHSVINAGVLLKGELTVRTEDDKTLQLKAGDPIIEVVNKRHYGKNEGKETAVILVFYAGTPDLPITIQN
jgi:quercetin dioxygenase-like cupin family protein